MKKITLAILLFSVIIKAQNPLMIKEVSSSLKPTGNSAKADLNYAKWNGKVFYSGSGSNLLCVTDGTAAGTIGISNLGGSTNISTIIPAQDFVYVITSDITFSPTTASTDKIWKSDGTTAGTSLVYAFQTASGLTKVGVYYSVASHKKNYSVEGCFHYEENKYNFHKCYNKTIKFLRTKYISETKADSILIEINNFIKGEEK